MTRLTQRPFAKRSPGPTCGLCLPRLPSSKAAWCCKPHAPSVHPSADLSDHAIRAHLAEFGIVAPVGRHGVEELLAVVADPNDKRVPEIACTCLSALGVQLRRIKEQILEFDRLIRAWHRSNEMSKRLEEVPGVGPVLATALVAAVADPKSFRSGRNFSAWIGMVPKQHSSGGKNRLGNISKQGDRYLPRPVCGRCAFCHPLRQDPWHQTSALAHGVAGTASDKGCRNSARQQDCANGLGHDGQGRAIQGTRRACAINEIAPGNRRDVKVGRANSTNAEPVDPAIRTTHMCQGILECELLVGT